MRLVLATLVVTLALSAAASADEGTRTIYAGGEFTLTPEGTVEQLRLRSGTASRSLDRIIRRTVSDWRFEPVLENGVAVSVPVGFVLRLRAVPEGNQYALHVDHVEFNELGELRPIRQPRPVYPEIAAERNLESRVRVYFLIGPDGRVQRTHVAQVGLNLRMDRSIENVRVQRLVNQMQREFSRAAEGAVRRWRFEGSGQTVAAAYTIDFMMIGSSVTEEARENYYWSAHSNAPWMHRDGSGSDRALIAAEDDTEAYADGILLPPDRIKPTTPVAGPVP